MFQTVVDWIADAGPFEALFLALMCSVVVVLLTGKRSEFSRHAQENISATVIVYLVNIGLVVLFWQDINAVLQAGYAALNIPRLPSEFWDGTPLVLMCLIGVLAKDFANYWLHRAMHMPLLWPTHAAHHSDTHVNAFTSYRVHILEYVFVQVGYLFLLTWLQMPETIPFVAAFVHMLNLYVHMDLDWDHGRFKYLLASPVFHRWHHADVPEAYGKNLCNVFPFYDVMFGTYHNPGLCHEEMGARKTGVEDKNPIRIMTYPFEEWGRMIRAVWSGSSASDRVPPSEEQAPKT